MSTARRRPRTALWILGWLLASLPAVAPRAEEPPPAEPDTPQEQTATTPTGAASETGTVEEALTPEERRAKAKAARIDEYLRKRDARRRETDERRATSAAEEREAEAQKIEKELATSAAAAEEPARTVAPPAAVLAAPAAGKKAAKAPRPSGLPRGLARAQANVRATDLGADPTVQEYLTLIDEQGASPHQLAAFGNFVGENGLIRDALEYYEVALRLEPNDPVLWINAGTLHIQDGSPSAAAKAFTHALSLNPNSAVAHYNLGAVLDTMDRYEDALLEYKAALTIDPSLGDPTHNPQAANNDHLTAVKLMLHQERAGSLSMGLIEIPTGEETPADGSNPD